MIRLVLFNALLLGSCGYALLRGTRDAKIVAIVTLVASFATLLLFRTYSEVETGVLVVDVLTFLAFTTVAIKSDRFWPLWISGLQLTTTFGHILKAFEDQLVPIAYAVALRSWSYPIQIILAVAVWRSQQRARAEREAAPVR